MRHPDSRTPFEIYDDMLADGNSFDKIANRLGWTLGQCRQHYMKICRELGVKPDVK